MWFNVRALGNDEARRQAWEYFAGVFADATRALCQFRGGVPHTSGLVGEPDENGLVYCGYDSWSLWSVGPHRGSRMIFW